MTVANDETSRSAPGDFIRDIVAEHVAEKRYPEIVTRFPPEPNGYLHIGHAKAICLDFGIALENGGRCNLRMDDTNPTKEEAEFVERIMRDVRWLIAGWGDQCLGLKPNGRKPAEKDGDFHQPAAEIMANSETSNLEPFFASDYFEAIHAFAVRLIKSGDAYVCDLSPAETEEYRGSPERPGKNSPYRDRSIEENLDLFERMRTGEFPDGARTLRARIDMTSPNIWMRDPLLYRIRHAHHHQTGDAWCIYPMYDFAHCLSDYIEGVTHSFCTLEFEVHRPLYDWILEKLSLPRPLPRQYEFAPLKVGFMIVSKRRLMRLVDEKVVSGWDDPRMPTLAGFRRRGVPASALRDFVTKLGVTKYNSLTDIAVFEHVIRQELNKTADRRMAVLRPLKLVLTNLSAENPVEVKAVNNPEDESAGSRTLFLTRELFIERDDFMEDPPKKFFRLKPGGDVRLKYGFIITCDEVVKNDAGEIVEVRCTADLDSRTGGATANRKVKGTIHWVSVPQALNAEVRLCDRLFKVPEPDADGDFMQHVNPESLEVITAKVEPALSDFPAGKTCQFERIGYFTPDSEDSSAEKLVFNRTITLRDNWAKLAGG